MSETKFGNFQDLLQMAGDGQEPLINHLKTMIEKLDPSATMVMRLGDRAATFGTGAKKMSEGYVYIMPHKKWVNLGFYYGAQLSDPKGLLQGTGKRLRHVKIHTEEDLELDGLKELIAEAILERKKALNIIRST